MRCPWHHPSISIAHALLILFVQVRNCLQQHAFVLRAGIITSQLGVVVDGGLLLISSFHPYRNYFLPLSICSCHHHAQPPTKHHHHSASRPAIHAKSLFSCCCYQGISGSVLDPSQLLLLVAFTIVLMLHAAAAVAVAADVDDNMICNEIGRGRSDEDDDATQRTGACIDKDLCLRPRSLACSTVVLLFLRNYPKIRGFFISLFRLL